MQKPQQQLLRVKGFHGDVVPQTPVSVVGDILDDTPVEDMMSLVKASKHESGGGLNLIGTICNIEHLDIEPDVPLHSDEDAMSLFTLMRML